MSELKLGNGLWERTTFNTRLQPERLYLGSAAVNNSFLELDYSYGTTDNNGNVRSQTITAPGGATFMQSYSYDSLNRLQSAAETVGAASNWKQLCSYDRYGNRMPAPGRVPLLLTSEQRLVCQPSLSPYPPLLLGLAA